jgi:transposase
VRDPEFHEKLLGLQSPWRVVDVRLDQEQKCVETFIAYEAPGRCPICDSAAPKHDHRERRWRHLDLYQYRAYVIARVPRVDCPEHGVQQLPVPWAEKNSNFTALFEALVISALHELSISGVAELLSLSWDETDTIMRRAVARGLERRQGRVLRKIGIDEKSVKKRHVYFTVVTDLERNEVVWVGRGRAQKSLDAFWEELSPEERSQIEWIAMDMHEPYFRSALAHVPEAKRKIVFDKFHVIQLLSRAVDQTRRILIREDDEHREGLKGTRFLWLHAKGRLSFQQRMQLIGMSYQYIRLGIAWGQKEQFAEFWKAETEMAARAFFSEWYERVKFSMNPPMTKAATTIQRYFENVVTYLKAKVTNAASESMNSRIQLLKFRSRGFRNPARFERAILFHCGGLDMKPAT